MQSTQRGFKTYAYTNGSFATGDRMKKAIDEGLSYIRFSCIGYTPKLYKKWMSEDNFSLLKGNIKETISYINKTGASTEVSSYHLILDNDNL